MALNAADPDANLYDGIYYCVNCGVGTHLLNIVSCLFKCVNCGSQEFISAVDFDLNKVLDRYEKE